MTLTTFGNQLHDVIYSTPSGLWVVWEQGKSAFKIINPCITSVSLSLERNCNQLYCLGDDYNSWVNSGIAGVDLDLSIRAMDIENKTIKRLSDIFTVKDLKEIAKISTQKFKRMGND